MKKNLGKKIVTVFSVAAFIGGAALAVKTLIGKFSDKDDEDDDFEKFFDDDDDEFDEIFSDSEKESRDYVTINITSDGSQKVEEEEKKEDKAQDSSKEIETEDKEDKENE